MKIRSLLMFLMLVNLGILMFQLSRTSPVAVNKTAPVLRRRELEILRYKIVWIGRISKDRRETDV